MASARGKQEKPTRKLRQPTPQKGTVKAVTSVESQDDSVAKFFGRRNAGLSRIEAEEAGKRLVAELQFLWSPYALGILNGLDHIKSLRSFMSIPADQEEYLDLIEEAAGNIFTSFESMRSAAFTEFSKRKSNLSFVEYISTVYSNASGMVQSQINAILGFPEILIDQYEVDPAIRKELFRLRAYAKALYAALQGTSQAFRPIISSDNGFQLFPPAPLSDKLSDSIQSVRLKLLRTYFGYDRLSENNPGVYFGSTLAVAAELESLSDIPDDLLLKRYFDSKGVSERHRARLIAIFHHLSVGEITGRPRWSDRGKYTELKSLSAPAFLRRVHADDIKNNVIYKERIRSFDPKLMDTVEAYISKRAKRSADEGDAKGLVLVASKPATNKPQP